MARKSDIRLRRSAVSGSVPGGADLNLGELALNTADGAIFVKNGAGNIVTVSHDGILHYDEANSRIGIGTTVPDKPLHVNGGTTDYVARFESSDNNAGIELKDSTSTSAIRTQNGHLVYIADTVDGVGSSSHRWNIDHLSTGEKMRLNAAGELGIGTQSPQAKLDIQNATAGTAASVVAAGTSAGIYLEDDQTPTDNYFVSKVHNPGNDTAIGGIKFAVSPDASNYSWAGIKGLTSASGNAGNLAFYTSAGNSSGDSSTERMRIDGAGNVGIGVTSLVNGDKLTVNGNINLNGKLFNGTSNNSAGLDFASNYVNYHGYAGHRFYAQAAGIGSMAERMRITVDGKVGIGTASPSSILDVAGSAAVLTITDTRSQTFTVGDTMCSLAFDSDDTSGGAGTASHPRALISLVAETTFGSSTGLSFSTKQDTTTAPTEKMRISTAGNVGIGITNPTGKFHLVDGNNFAQIGDLQGNSTMSLRLADTNGQPVEVQAYGSELRFNTATSSGATPSVKMNILANGNVGIGTSSPSRKLEVNAGSASMVAQFKSTLTSSFVCFANSSSTADQVRIGSNGTALTLSTNYAERMRIDSSGNVLVATTDDVVWNNSANSSADKGHNLRSDGRAGFAYYNATANANATVNINRTGSDGDLIRLFKSGSQVGSIGTAGGQFNIGLNTTSGLQFATNLIYPRGTGNTTQDGTISLGNSGNRFKDLHLSGKVNAAKAEFTSGSADHIYLNRSGHDSFRIALSHGTGLSFHNQTDSRTDIMVDGSGNIIFGGVSVGAAGAMSVKVDGSYTDLYLYGAGTSQGGRIFFGDSSDRSSIVGTYGTGGGGKLSFKTDTTGGTSQDRLVIDSDGSITFNGAFTFPTTIGSAGQILKVPATGTELIWGADAGGGSATLLTDGDGDTLIQVEKNTDEDIIRFDIAGTEQLQLNSTGLVVAGNLTVNGTQTILNTATLSVDDLNITVADGAANAAAANGAGLTVDGANATLTYTSTEDRWNFNKKLYVPDNIRIAAGAPSLILQDTTDDDDHSIRFMDNGGTNRMSITTGGDNLNFETTGSRDFTFMGDTSGSGNVGIGTTSPAAKLNVYTDTGRNFKVDHGTANRTILSTDRGMIVKAGAGYSLELDTGSDTGSILFKDNGVTHSQFNASGNLALGTTTHFATGGAAKLSVAGILSIGISNSDMSYIRRQSTGNYAWQTYNNDNTGTIQLQPYGGNVGIGTAAPGYKLHIIETGTNAGAIYVEDGTSWLRVVPNLGGSGFNPMSVTGDIGLIFSNDNDNSTNSSTNGLLIAPHSASASGIKILEDGRVGIATTTPNSRFTVNVGSQGDGIELQSNETSIAKLSRTTVGSTVVASLDGVAGRPINIGGIINEDVLLANAGGNVGIGTDNPTTKLHLSGDIVNLSLDGTGAAGTPITSISLARGSVDWGIHSGIGGANLFGIKDNQNSAYRLAIDTAGKVGIGTTSPSEKLHVAGNQYIDGNLQIKSAGVGNAMSILQSTSGNIVAKMGESAVGHGFLTLYEVSVGDVIKFDANADSFINRGKLGIGTNTPDTKLDITTSGVEGLILNQDTASAATSSRLFFKDNVRINGMLNVNGILEFRTGMVVGSTSGTKRLTVSPTLVKSEVPLRVEEYQIDTTTSSTSATTQVAIHTFAAATFRSARFTIQITNTTDSTYHSTEILAIHDGTTANITEFGEVHTGSSVEATFDADVSSGNFRLLATPTSTNSMVFKVVCHSLTV